MVSIAAFQAVDPGSIPGRRSVVFALFFVLHYVYYYLLERSPQLEEIEQEPQDNRELTTKRICQTNKTRSILLVRRGVLK